MSINQTIKAALEPIVVVVKPDIYKGNQKEYVVFNYAELPEDFGDNKPNAIRYLIQLHWFLPSDVSPTTKKKQIKNALLNAGFTYPIVTNATDEDGRHYVLECEYVDGDI